VGDGVPQKLGADLVGDGLAEMYMYASDVISSVSGVGGCEIGDLDEQWERCFHVMMLRWHFFLGNGIGSYLHSSQKCLEFSDLGFKCKSKFVREWTRAS
jgi:hypothetical protein